MPHGRCLDEPPIRQQVFHAGVPTHAVQRAVHAHYTPVSFPLYARESARVQVLHMPHAAHVLFRYIPLFSVRGEHQSEQFPVVSSES